MVNGWNRPTEEVIEVGAVREFKSRLEDTHVPAPGEDSVRVITLRRIGNGEWTSLIFNLQRRLESVGVT